MFDRWGHSILKQELIRIYTKVFFDLFLNKILPYRVFILSDKYPTIGVATPSVICPAKIAAEAASVFTICCKKKNR